jgi:hypothetical protein
MQDEINNELVDALMTEMEELFIDLNPKDCLVAAVGITSFLIQKYSPEEKHADIVTECTSFLRRTLSLDPMPLKASH